MQLKAIVLSRVGVFQLYVCVRSSTSEFEGRPLDSV